MNWLFALLGISGSLMTIYLAYYLYLSLASLKAIPPLPETGHYHRLAVVIPARNEASVIGSLIDSLKQQDYPAEWFDIYVLANNCTDNTEAIARDKGVRLAPMPSQVKSKGQALAAFFQDHLNRSDYDGYVFFDADNVVASDFLSLANQSLSAGYSAMVGFRDSKNPYQSLVSGSYTIMYYCLNRLYNQARAHHQLTAMISGTGFMLSREHLKRLGGWQTETLIEDAEITVQTALSGQSIRYEPRARFYDEQVADWRTSWRQRFRWSVGSQQNMRRYGWDLVAELTSRHRKNVFDQLMMLSATYSQIISVILLVVTIILERLSPANATYSYAIGLSLLGLVLGPSLMAVIVLKLEHKPLRPMLGAIAIFWLFMLSWLPINLVALFHRTTTWKPIHHQAQVSLEDLMKNN